MDNLTEKQKEQANIIFNSVKTHQPNANAFVIMRLLCTGMSLAEIMDEDTLRILNQKEVVNEQIQDKLSDESIDYYNEVMVKGYPLLMDQLAIFREHLSRLDKDKRESDRTLNFLGDLSKAIGMYSDSDEVDRLSKLEGAEFMDFNVHDVDQNLAYINGYVDSIKNANPEAEKPYGLDFDELGITDIKADLDASMKHSHSKISVQMQNSLNDFMDKINNATKPYSKETLEGINKSLKALQYSTRAYVNYKSKENPTKGTGYDRLMIAERLDRAVNNIAGRVDVYSHEELAKLFDPEMMKIAQTKKVTRYVAVSGEEFAKTSDEEAKTIAERRTLKKGTFKELSQELKELSDANVKDAELKRFSAKMEELVEAENDYETKHTKFFREQYRAARDEFMGALDKYVTSIYEKGLSSKDNAKLELIDKISDTLTLAKIKDDIRPVERMLEDMKIKHNLRMHYSTTALKQLTGMDHEAGKTVSSDYTDALIKAGFSAGPAMRLPSVTMNSLAYYRFLKGESFEQSLKNFNDPEYVDAAVREYADFIRSHELFPLKNNLKPYVDEKSDAFLKKNAEFYKSWTKTILDVKIEPITNENFTEMVEKYMSLADEAIEISQNEQDLKYMTDDYFKHWGGKEERRNYVDKQMAVQAMGSAARYITSSDQNYCIRAAAKMVLEDLTQTYAGKKFGELDADTLHATAGLSTGVGAFLSSKKEACERYVNGCATDKDIRELKELYVAGKESIIQASKNAGKEQREADLKKLGELEQKAVYTDIIDSKIKLLEFDYKKTGNPLRQKLADTLKNPKERAILCSKMEKSKKIKDFVENSKGLSTKDFDAKADELITEIGLPQASKENSKVLKIAKSMEDAIKKGPQMAPKAP